MSETGELAQKARAADEAMQDLFERVRRLEEVSTERGADAMTLPGRVSRLETGRMVIIDQLRNLTDALPMNITRIDESTPADTLAWRAEVSMFAAIGEDVAEQARALFEDAGEPDDYCHQTRLVFGGTNRITLTRWGWRADPGACSPRFYERFAKLVTK